MAVEPFTPESLEAFAKLLGEQFTGSEITQIFRRAGFQRISEYSGTKWRYSLQALEDLQDEAGAEGVLGVLRSMCHPVNYVGNRERLDEMITSINQILGFSGLRILDDGRFVEVGFRETTVPYEKTEDERALELYELHPEVLRHADTHFRRGAYAHAILECCKALDHVVRSNTGSEKSGQGLMGVAFGENGTLKINGLRTQSERDQQQGFMYLCMGVMTAVRNPHSHETILGMPMSRQDGLDLLGLLSYLFRKIETANVITKDSKGTLGVAKVEI